MVWGEGIPSGRDRAIETLIDVEPHGAFHRAVRVLDEIVPQSMVNRPNLVTKTALVEQAHALAEHAIDNVLKYDVAFPSSLQKIPTSNAAVLSLSSLRKSATLNSTIKERILRHHAKLSNNQLQRRSAKPINSSSITATASCAPSPQLVAALRHIYGSNENDPPIFTFRSLLEALMNHSALDLSSVSPSIRTPQPSNSTISVSDKDKTKDESFTSIGSSYNVKTESLIANVCGLASYTAVATDHHFNSILQGLLIAILSVITDCPECGNEAVQDEHPSTKRRPRQQTDTTEDFPTLPTALQVGAVLNLLDSANENDCFSIDPEILSYFGEAAAVYEARIEIKKARLLAKLQEVEKERESVSGIHRPDPLATAPITITSASEDTPIHASVPLTPTEGAFDIHDANNFSSDENAIASAAVVEEEQDTDGHHLESLNQIADDVVLDTAAVLDQIISSTATGDETSSSNAEEENVSSESESDNSEDNESDTMGGCYDDIGNGEVMDHDLVHGHVHDDSGPAEDIQDEDSSSSSSGVNDDIATMDEDRVIESEVEQDEEDAVLRQALALSLAEKNTVDCEDDRNSDTLLQVETNREPFMALSGTERTDNSDSGCNELKTLISSCDVEVEKDETKNDSKDNDDSSLPPLPSPPSFYPFESVMLGHRGEVVLSELEGNKSPSPYFDPSALNKFGILPTSHVLIHLLRHATKFVDQYKSKSIVIDRPVDTSNSIDEASNPIRGGMGRSLFLSEQLLTQSGGNLKANDKTDDSSASLSIQLLVACFLLIIEKRNDSIENLRKSLAREYRNVQDEDHEDEDVDKNRGAGNEKALLSSEEEDDPAIALAMNSVEDTAIESSESLEAKGMRRKAAAAAHDNAALLKSLRKRTDAWKRSVKLYSQCAVYALRNIRLFLQAIVRNWLIKNKCNTNILTGISITEYLPSSVRSKLSMSLASLTSVHIHKSCAASISNLKDSEIDELLMTVKLYKEATMTLPECVPFFHSSAAAQFEMLRSLIQDCSSGASSEPLPQFIPFESLLVLPHSDSESRLHQLQMLCRRLRVSDLLESFVPSPMCFLSGEKTSVACTDTQPMLEEKDQDPIFFHSVVSLVSSSVKEIFVLKNDLQQLYLALCHKCHERILLWDRLFECAKVELDDVTGTVVAPSSTTSSDLVRVNANPSSSLQFDATKCSDSIAILSATGDSSSLSSSSAANGSSVHQRASKVWGTVLSTLYFSPKTGVHRWAVRLDKCERGHVFIGVATAQSSMRTYVGGDKYGWGMIGTQALWHDRRKIRGDYGATFRTGSTIIVTLDTDAGTLSFSSWKDSNSCTSFSLDPMRRRHGHVGGNIEEWGVAFEGLPLDSRLYPSVGLYQRDDRVTLLTVENRGRSGGHDGIVDVSGGRSYYPRIELNQEKVHSERILRLRQFNDSLLKNGIQYVMETLQQIRKCYRENNDEFMLTKLLPCLAAALCLIPSSIPVLSERLALTLLPHLSKTISELESIRGDQQMVHKIFRTGLREGKWIIRATGSSGASNDFEEYVVDFSASVDDHGTALGFQGTGVGTTGKSKNGAVSIFGTVKGSSVHFVEEWSDGSENGFESGSHDETSSCVVAARMSLDGLKFEGTYRNVQYGTVGQIAGTLCGESTALSKFKLKDAPLYSKQNAGLAGAILSSEAILCLAHSHLATIIGEDAAKDQSFLAIHKKPSNYSVLQWEYTCANLQSCLSRPLLSGFSLKTTRTSVSRQVNYLRNLYYSNENTISGQEICHHDMLDGRMIQELILSTRTKSNAFPSMADVEDRVASMESEIIDVSGGLGSLSKICPSVYRSARIKINCAFIRHCNLHEELFSNTGLDALKNVWRSSLKIMESGLRKALSDAKRSLSVKEACLQQCVLHNKISLFLLSLENHSNVVSSVEEVSHEFLWFYNIICHENELEYLEGAMEAASRRALLRLVSLKEVASLIDDTGGRALVDNPIAMESVVVGLPKLLGRGRSDVMSLVSKQTDNRFGFEQIHELAGHYLSGLSGSDGIARLAIQKNVHHIFHTLGRYAQKMLKKRTANISAESLTSIDSLTLSVLAVFTSALKYNDIETVIQGSGILQILQQVISVHRNACLNGGNGTGSDKVSIVEDLRFICQIEVSKSILRAAVAAAHLLIYQIVSCAKLDAILEPQDKERSTTSLCLDLLLNELTDSISSIESSAVETVNQTVEDRSEVDWEKWCDVGQAQFLGHDPKKKDPQHEVGSSGLKFLRDRGMTHSSPIPLSSTKSQSRQKGNNTAARLMPSDSKNQRASFACQYLSNWLHVLCCVMKSPSSILLISCDSRWIDTLLNAVGLFTVRNTKGEVAEVSTRDRETGLLPGRFRARILRLILFIFDTLKPCEATVRGIFNLAGISASVAAHIVDEDEVNVSREAVSLLRHLHSPSRPGWRECVNRSISIILDSKADDTRIGLLLFLSGDLNAVSRGSYVLLKPAAAAPLSVDQHSSPSSKSHSSGVGGSSGSIFGATPHHIIGNGTEGVVTGLCRYDASAGLVSSIDMKNGICEIILLTRSKFDDDGLDYTHEGAFKSKVTISGHKKSSMYRHNLTVRALRTPLSDVVKAQEVPLYLDESVPLKGLLGHMLQSSFATLHSKTSCTEGENLVTREQDIAQNKSKLINIRSEISDMSIALMTLRSAVVVLSNKSILLSFLQGDSARSTLADVLKLAWPTEANGEVMSDFVHVARRKYVSSLPVHEARYGHLFSLFGDLSFRTKVLGETSKSKWKKRIEELITRRSDDAGIKDVGIVGAPEGYRTPPVDSASGPSTPPVLTSSSNAAVNGDMDSSVRNTDSASNHAISQSTAESNSDDDDDSEAAATAAAHLREAAIAQMAELGLPRSWSELALRRTGGTNIEAAVHYCLNNEGEMERLLAEERDRERIMQRQTSSSQSSRRRGYRGDAGTSNHLLRQLLEMGFPSRWCAEALAATGNNVDEALTWILTNGERLSEEDEALEEDGDGDDIDEDEDESIDDEDEEDDKGELCSEQESTNGADNIAKKSSSDKDKLSKSWSGSAVPLRFISGRSIIDPKTLAISGLPTGGFSSVGTKGVLLTSGKWYYEAILETAGCLQIGWADGSFAGHCHADRGDGCGDGPSSWAFDGWRRYRWHSTATEWGCRWKEGDVVGCLVDLDERVVSFTLNGRGDQIGMGVAFSGSGFRPCGGVYACVSFNRREKLRLILGGKENEPFTHQPPPGFRGVGEAVLDAVLERDFIVDKEAALHPCQPSDRQDTGRFLCDFSDGEHGHELMAWAHRYYGSDASVHLGSARSKHSSGAQKGSTPINDSSFVSCNSRRVEKAWASIESMHQLSSTDGNNDHIEIVSQMKAGYEEVGKKISDQLTNECIAISILFSRKLILHLIVTMGSSFNLKHFISKEGDEISTARLFCMVLEICGSLRCAGWVGEAGAMAIAAEALGLGISSNENSHSRQNVLERSGIISITDLDDGLFLPTGGITQLLSSVLTTNTKSLAQETGCSLAAAAETAFGSDGGGGVLVFLQEGLLSAVSKSEDLRTVLISAIRRSVRILAVVEYEGDDSDASELNEDENDSEKTSSSMQRRSITNKNEESSEQEFSKLPDARLTSFFTGLLLSKFVQKSVQNHSNVQESLFQAWSIGLLSASLPWRMICAFTSAGILEQCPRALSKAIKSLPTLAKFFGRLESTVARRVWAERAAVPVCSRYVQSIIELLASVKRAVHDSELPPEFNKFWGKITVDAATPLPLKAKESSVPSTSDLSCWESDDGWVSSDISWEVWTGTVEYMAVDWKTPSRSAVRTLMDGGEGPPMLREGCLVMRGLDWEGESTDMKRENEDGKDIYELGKTKREEEKRRESNTASENTDSKSSEQERGSNPELPDDAGHSADPTEETQNQDPASVPDDCMSSKENSVNQCKSKKKKRKLPNPKLPLGTVISVESWNGIPGMARRVRWNLTGKEGVYRYGGDGGRYDISHVEVNEKATRVKKRHPLPESAEQCVARHGFGMNKRYCVLLRLNRSASKNIVDDCIEYVHHGIMEWPDFGAGVRVSCTLHADGAVSILEEELVFGSTDSGWEARFGQPSFVAGTIVILSPTKSSSTSSQAEIDTRSSYLSFYEELLGSSSFQVKNLRNREDGSTIRVTSEMHLFRGRGASQSKNRIVESLASPLPPPIHFDRDYHASSLSLSRDGRTVSCVASDGRGTAFASVGFTKGIHYWEVKLEQADIGSVFIGVAEKPSGSGSGSSYGYDSPPRLNRWHGWGFVNFRATYTSGAERVYGAHCHAGDTVGVMLDCDAGRISFFFDGLKYGEHILNDLGCAFENNSPFGFNVDGCGSGGAGQGAPSGTEGGRGGRYPAQGAVRPKALWPVIGLRNEGDRVTISPKWTSSYGVDGATTISNVLSVDEILYTYSKHMDLTSPDNEEHEFPDWFVLEAFSEYKRWHSKSWRRTITRGSGAYRFASFGLDVDLNTSPISCASASAGLGLKCALLAGDRVRLVRSAGRLLELAEEAVVLGAYHGRLFYRIVSQKSEGGSLTEGGGRAWCWDESEVVDGLPFIGKGKVEGIKLPILDRFKCLSPGGLKIVFDGGAVVRSDLEIFDGSTNLGTIPVNSIIPQTDVLERRVNSCGVVRYRVRFEGVEGEGWISARLRGGKEECIVEPIHTKEEGSLDSNECSFPTPLDCALVWHKEFQNSPEHSDSFSPIESATSVGNITEFKKLLSQGIIPGKSVVESDSLLTSAIASISNFSESGDAVDSPFQDIADAISFTILFRSNKNSETEKGSVAANQAAASVFASVDVELPALNALMARSAVLKALNRRARLALPWMSVRPCQEGSAILGGLCGHGASTERSGRNKQSSSHSNWIQLPSIASRIRNLRCLFFTSVKRGLLQSISEATATPTPLSHDEYELPREIRTVRINRLKARRAMNSDDVGTKRKYSVFAQLHNETKGWGGAALRREYVAKGHGGQRRAFKVKLIGEGVNDYSGPYREVFTDAMTELLDVSKFGGALGVIDPTPNKRSEIGEDRELCMFSLNGAELLNSTKWQNTIISAEETCIRESFSTLTAVRDENAREVEEALVFLGRIVGTSYRHGIPLDIPLPLHTVWKSIVEESPTDKQRMLELDYLAYKQMERTESRDTQLLLWQRRMLNSFVEGLSNVLPVEVLTLFTGEELRDTFCGNPDVDVDLLRRVVEYEGYKESDAVIQYFWETLRELSNVERKVFLQFVWARNRLPLKESDFEAPFKIQKDSSSNKDHTDNVLPSASTCFFSLTLPEYSTKTVLKDKLLFAINNVTTMETDFQTNSAEIAEGYREN